MAAPHGGVPIGLQLARTTHVLTQEFERAMTQAGASAAAWQVLVAVRSGRGGTQGELARVMGLTGATLTYHLNALERDGLVRRWRDPANRRVQRTELTDDGVAVFDRLRHVAARHDARIRTLLGEKDVHALSDLLGRLSAGFADPA